MLTPSFLYAIIGKSNGRVVQLVRMPACHAGGRGFEPLLGRKYAQVILTWAIFLLILWK